MRCQYMAGHVVAPEGGVILEGVGACVDIGRRRGTSSRRRRLLCSDGLTRHMLVLVRVVYIAVAVLRMRGAPGSLHHAFMRSCCLYRNVCSTLCLHHPSSVRLTLLIDSHTHM